MRVCDVMHKIDKIKIDSDRIKEKLPKVMDNDTTIELNYFKDIRPLLSIANELIIMLGELEVSYRNDRE